MSGCIVDVGIPFEFIRVLLIGGSPTRMCHDRITGARGGFYAGASMTFVIRVPIQCDMAVIDG